MRYLHQAPSPRLADVVDMLWSYDGYRPPHEFERVFPTGTVEILLNLKDGRLGCHSPETGRVIGTWSGLLVAGVHHCFQLVDTAQQYSMLGVALKPGAAWRLLGIDAHELTDRHVALEAILGPCARRLAEKLWEAKDQPKRMLLLDTELSRLPRRPLHPAVDWAAGQMVAFPDTSRIGNLVDEAGMSARRFHQVFRREIGIAPIAFARIRRFQGALGRLGQSAMGRMAQLAIDSGYADQAHMIREFREFSGFTPAQYTRIPVEYLCHVPHPERDQICPAPEAAAAAGA